jgi:hypothetical protein
LAGAAAATATIRSPRITNIARPRDDARTAISAGIAADSSAIAALIS